MFRELTIARARHDDAHNEAVSQAWLTASLARAKKIPPLRQLLRRGAKRQSVDEQRSVLHMLSAQYGFPLRKAKGRRG